MPIPWALAFFYKTFSRWWLKKRLKKRVNSLRHEEETMDRFFTFVKTFGRGKGTITLVGIGVLYVVAVRFGLDPLANPEIKQTVSDLWKLLLTLTLGRKLDR